MSSLVEKVRLFPRYVFFAAKQLFDQHELAPLENRRSNEIFEQTVNFIESIRYSQAKNSFAKFGASYFSQGDEDGLTLEILSRINPTRKTFLEFGVGDGSENNTLILRASGYKGAWIDALQNEHLEAGNNESFYYSSKWIDKDTITLILSEFKEVYSADPCVISLDLDGNDFWIWNRILQLGIRPQLAIAEYNAKFPFPIEWVMDYNLAHEWQEDDYYGASFASFVKLFAEYGYSPVVCSIHGTNVFFVQNSQINLFPEIPSNSSIFQDPFYAFRKKNGHPVSNRTILSILKGIKIEQ